MKRVVCLLLVVSIACAGCADKKQSKVTVVRLPPIWDPPGDLESMSVLRLKNKILEGELSAAKIMLKQSEFLPFRISELESALESQRAASIEYIAKLECERDESKIIHKQNEALLVRIDDLEAALEFQGAVESVDKSLLVKISKLESALESQRAVIENLKNLYRLHESALEYQRVALESLLNLCRLYEAKIESQREVVKDCGF